MLEGAARHSKRLAKLANNALEMNKTVYAAADFIRVEARRSITEGAVSGKFHVPSRPGEPPKADTHDLDSKIVTELVGPGEARVRSYSGHAVFMEFGTRTIAERPYMRPAVKKAMPKVKGLIVASIKRQIQES